MGRPSTGSGTVGGLLRRLSGRSTSRLAFFVLRRAQQPCGGTLRQAQGPCGGGGRGYKIWGKREKVE